MVRNYAGVGKRTAEALVDHFGPGVFEVIDSAPARLTEVLSEGRAKAVVAAREQERAE
jgi:uroporphyrinogen-III synthase